MSKSRRLPGYCIRQARVVRASPGLQYYRILIDGMGGVGGAVPIYQGGDLYGARTYVTYPTGSIVLVLITEKIQDERFRSNDRYCGYILGVLPTPATNATFRQGDNSQVHTLSGWLRDSVHTWDNTKRKQDIQRKNYNSYQPFDGLSGEWGVFSPLGPGIFQGMLMSYLRGSDRCGVWTFTQDDLIRVMGKNLEQFTFSREIDDSFVSGELSVMENTALYPWEGLGSFDHETPVGKKENVNTYSETESETRPPMRAAQERQRGVFRLRHVRGYPGDVDQQFVCVPTGEGVDRYGQNEDKFPGVFRQDIGSDGSYLLQSAKSITLEKTILIPFPIELRRPHDPQGDLNPGTPAETGDGEAGEDSEYLASGIYSIRKAADEEAAQAAGSEAKPHQRFDFKGVEDDLTPASRPMLGMELHGFRARETIKNLLRHELNWKTPEEMDTSVFTEDGPAINVGPEFRLDPTVQHMPLPRVKELKVDHRYPVCKYYASTARIEITDDGSIIMEDAYGSQFIMTGGSIYRQCANDLVDLPGRSSIVLAPKDIVQRAGRDIDLTSSYGDVRIKAEYNLMMIGGNAGDRGGVLVESRNEQARDDYTYVAGVGSDIQGLVLSNPLGTLALLAQDIVGRAGVDADSASDGLISFMTGGDLHFEAANVLANVSEKYTVLSGPDGDDLTDLGRKSILNFTASSLDLLGLGSIYTDAAITASSGMTATGFDSESQTQTELTETLTERLNDDVLPDVEQTHRSLLEAAYELDGDAVGDGRLNYFNSDELYHVQASLRTQEDYGTAEESGFLLHEGRWQQMAKVAEVEQRFWSEPVVRFDDGEKSIETAPWPGKEPWSDKNRMIKIKAGQTNFDMLTGKSRRFDPNKDDTEDQVGLSIEVEKSIPSGSFLVNFEPTER